MLEDSPSVCKECGNDGIVIATRVDWVIYVDQAQNPAIAIEECSDNASRTGSTTISASVIFILLQFLFEAILTINAPSVES